MPVNELDRLIHSKVMGQPLDVPCTQDHNLIDGEYWRCACGWISTDLDHTEHAQKIPAYSTDLNEAWKVFLHMLGGYWNEKDKWNERHNLGFYEFATALLDEDDWIYSDEVFPGRDIFPIVSRWTPEKIVLAALKAYGVEIESDHAS